MFSFLFSNKYRKTNATAANLLLLSVYIDSITKFIIPNTAIAEIIEIDNIFLTFVYSSLPIKQTINLAAEMHKAGNMGIK